MRGKKSFKLDIMAGEKELPLPIIYMYASHVNLNFQFECPIEYALHYVHILFLGRFASRTVTRLLSYMKGKPNYITSKSIAAYYEINAIESFCFSAFSVNI